MKIFRKPSFADSTGDAIPFYHNGMYHIFSLTPPFSTTVYPDRLRTTWSHTVSKDLVNWEEIETALYPGEDKEPDASGVWTGSVIYGEGKYHIFYTGYNINAYFQQTICHATSDDGIKWVKDSKNPVIVPIEELYEIVDWRDPYIFYNEEEKCYWMLISARPKKGPLSKRGAVVLYRSDNLENWEHYGPVYQPYHTNCPECSEMYKIGDNWYLSYSRFSEFVNTIYRISKSPFGPWRTPKMDGIGGRRFYAAKSLENDEGRRFYFGWIHDRANQNDEGEWYWGGEFCIPHEVYVNENEELNVKMPVEIENEFKEKIDWQYKSKLGNSKNYGNKLIEINSIGTMSYGFIENKEETFLFKCKIKSSDCNDQFGILLKSNEEISQCLMLTFDVGMQRVSLLNLPMDVDPFWRQSCTNIGNPKNPGPDGIRVCEKPFNFKNGDNIDIKILIDKDIMEIFVDQKIAFTYRLYKKQEQEIGIFVQDGNAEFYNIELLK
jgi:Beta-fructosidases (levanase/invertase)